MKFIDEGGIMYAVLTRLLSTNWVHDNAATLGSLLTKQNPRKMLPDGSTYIGLRGSGQGGGSTPQDSQKAT